MDYLFSSPGLAALDRVNARSTLIAFDFDGTLAPIVEDPDAAFMSPEMEGAFRALARLRPVAVITGRAVADLAVRMPLPAERLYGNHGIENGPGWPQSASTHRAVVDTWRRELVASGLGFSRGPECWIEDKAFSLSVHYHPDRVPAAQLGVRLRALMPPPRVIPGHHLFNLVPRGAPHKGRALLLAAERAGCDRAIYVGDDHTDEDAFEISEVPLLAVRVGYRADSRAHCYVRDLADVRRLIDALTVAV